MKLPVLSIRHVWVAITLGAAFIGPASYPIGVPDIFWTLLTGAWIVSHGALLETDPFTTAPHVPGHILNVQWLADVAFHVLDAAGGLPLVITGTALLIATTFGVLLAAAVTASGHLRLSCVAVWIAYVLGATNLSPRPQTLAYPIFAAFLFAIMRAEWRKDTRWLWLLPPLTVVWANLHGSFSTGFALLGCAAAGRLVEQRSVSAMRPNLLTLGGCLLAALVNPYGLGSLVYVATIGNDPVIRDFVTEWAPTTLAQQEGILFFGSVGLLGLLILKSHLRLTAFEILLLLVFGYLGWSSVRAVVWWGLAIAPILARQLGRLLPSRMPTGRDLPVLNGIILAGIVCLAVVSLPWNKAALPFLPADKRGLFTDDTPIGVGDYLHRHAPPATGVMFNNQGWGGYLEWAAWPQHQVFLDGRFELHPDQVWFDYLDVIFPSTRWAALLDQYDVSYLVLSKIDQAELIGDLRVDPAWRLDYEDDQGVVFTRSAD